MNAFTQTLNQAAEAWRLFVIHVTWQASLLAVLLMAVVLLGRRWASPLRYWLLVLVLCKFTLPPLVALPTGLFRHVGPTVATVTADSTTGSPLPANPAPVEAMLPPRAPADAVAQLPVQAARTSALPADLSDPAVSLKAVTWLMLMHMLGVAILATWILAEYCKLSRLLRRAEVVKGGNLLSRFDLLSQRLGLRKPVYLVRTATLSGPAAFGLFRRVVVLPEAVVNIDSAELDTILAHELAHHRRGDLWINTLQVALAVAWWFNPILWMLNRQIRKVREDCCDDILLTKNLTTGPVYCETLLHAATAVNKRKTLAVTLGFGEQLHSLGQRFERLMDNTLRRANRLSVSGACLLIVLAALVLPGLHRSSGGEPGREVTPVVPSLPIPGQKAGTNDALVIAGRVIDPTGKPFAGAKLYGMVKSAMRETPRLKDPNTKFVEQRIVDGKIQVFVVNPELIAIMKKHGLDPAKPIDQNMFDKAEIHAEVLELQRKLYEPNPFLIPTVNAISGPDGRFRFTLSESLVKKTPYQDIEVYAFADHYGPGWAWASSNEGLKDLTVRLVEDTPIKGRIIDLEGRPVPGVVVKLGSIMVGPDGTIKLWQEFVDAAIKGDASRQNELLPKVLERQLLNNNFSQIPKSVTTDKDGRFSIQGIGANRVLFRIEITGPSIGHDMFSVVTCAETGIPMPRPALNTLRAEYRTYPATFEHVVKPVRVLTGTVRDSATGKPVEGVQVAAWGPAYVESFTDKDGHYKLVGLSKAKDYTVTFWPFNAFKKPLPYLNETVRIQDAPGSAPVTTDVNLVRGVILKGALINQATGKPISGRAMVWYATFTDNPHVTPFAFTGNPKYAGQTEFIGVPFLQQTHANIPSDGKFQIVVLPGRGVLGVRVEQDGYAPATLPEADLDDRFWDKTVPGIAHSTSEFQAAKLVNVPDNVAEISTDLSVSPKK